ncbi:TIGR03745 family integrating conjugative element membrane protein [Alcaligenes aquatilis]|nr:TIGR03745 family integrating conjugative element membrane protein [Alcaligenes aquatilis]
MRPLRSVPSAQPVLAASLLALLSLDFSRGSPAMKNPSRGTGSGIIQTIQNYGYDMVVLVALLMVAAMFIRICYRPTCVQAFASGTTKSRASAYRKACCTPKLALLPYELHARKQA